MLSSYLGSMAAVMSDAMKPGATALQVMLRAANSRATAFVSPMTPAWQFVMHQPHKGVLYACSLCHRRYLTHHSAILAAYNGFVFLCLLICSAFCQLSSFCSSGCRCSMHLSAPAWKTRSCSLDKATLHMAHSRPQTLLYSILRAPFIHSNC